MRSLRHMQQVSLERNGRNRMMLINLLINQLTEYNSNNLKCKNKLTSQRLISSITQASIELKLIEPSHRKNEYKIKLKLI